MADDDDVVCECGHKSYEWHTSAYGCTFPMEGEWWCRCTESAVMTIGAVVRRA